MTNATDDKTITEFLSALDKLVRRHLDFMVDDLGFSFFSDIYCSGYEGDELTQFRHSYAKEVDSEFAIEAFEVTVSDIQLRTDADDYTDGDATLTFRLDIGMLFADYDPELLHPFSTMLYVKLVHNCLDEYTVACDPASRKHLQFASPSSYRLLQMAERERVQDATRTMQMEMYKSVLRDFD
jgi:hypothetical protein